MIEIFKTINGGLAEQKQFNKGTWINAKSPTDLDLEKLKKLTGKLDEFEGFITSLKDPEEQARVETENGALFIVLRIPYTTKKGDETIHTTRPLGIIRMKDYLITISYFETEVLDRLAKQKIETQHKIETILNIFLITAR